MTLLQEGVEDRRWYTMPFDLHTHGLWLLGGIFMFVAALIAGNVELAEGATPVSFWLAVALSFVLFLIAGVCWISAAINSRK